VRVAEDDPEVQAVAADALRSGSGAGREGAERGEIRRLEQAHLVLVQVRDQHPLPVERRLVAVAEAVAGQDREKRAVGGADYGDGRTRRGNPDIRTVESRHAGIDGSRHGHEDRAGGVELEELLGAGVGDPHVRTVEDGTREAGETGRDVGRGPWDRRAGRDDRAASARRVVAEIGGPDLRSVEGDPEGPIAEVRRDGRDGTRRLARVDHVEGAGRVDERGSEDLPHRHERLLDARRSRPGVQELAVARPHARDRRAVEARRPDIGAVGPGPLGAVGEVGQRKHGVVLRDPELPGRRPRAPALQDRVHGSREEGRHLEACDARGRIVGRRRGSGRDPQVEDLQDVLTEESVVDVQEGAADPERGEGRSGQDGGESQWDEQLRKEVSLHNPLLYEEVWIRKTIVRQLLPFRRRRSRGAADYLRWPRSRSLTISLSSRTTRLRSRESAEAGVGAEAGADFAGGEAGGSIRNEGWASSGRAEVAGLAWAGAFAAAFCSAGGGAAFS